MVVKFFEKNYLVSIFVSLMLASFIFYVSSIDTFAGAGYAGNVLADFYHFSVFFTLAAFFLMAVVRGKDKNYFIPGVIFLIFYSISDEFHQLFVPGRFASFGDVLVDSAGIFLATLIYIMILYYRDKK